MQKLAFMFTRFLSLRRNLFSNIYSQKYARVDHADNTRELKYARADHEPVILNYFSFWIFRCFNYKIDATFDGLKRCDLNGGT